MSPPGGASPPRAHPSKDLRIGQHDELGWLIGPALCKNTIHQAELTFPRHVSDLCDRNGIHVLLAQQISESFCLPCDQDDALPLAPQLGNVSKGLSELSTISGRCHKGPAISQRGILQTVSEVDGVASRQPFL